MTIKNICIFEVFFFHSKNIDDAETLNVLEPYSTIEMSGTISDLQALQHDQSLRHSANHRILFKSYPDNKHIYMQNEVSVENADTSEDDSNDDVTTWCDYSNKLDFALKLGYHEAQLKRVLLHNGPHVSKDVLLGDLIGLDKDKGFDECTYDEANNTGYHEQQIRTHSMATSEDMAVVEDDPESNLRYIVIDGSNVAMR